PFSRCDPLLWFRGFVKHPLHRLTYPRIQADIFGGFAWVNVALAAVILVDDGRGIVYGRHGFSWQGVLLGEVPASWLAAMVRGVFVIPLRCLAPSGVFAKQHH